MGLGNSIEEAEADAIKDGPWKVRKKWDFTPCPSCGSYQPQMVGRKRFLFHLLLLVPNLLWLLPLILDFNGEIPRVIATTGLALVSLAIGLLHVNLILRYPNNGSQANLRRGKSLVQQGLLRVDKPPQTAGPYPKPPETRPGRAFKILAILWLTSFALFTASELLRWSQDWPLNEKWHPVVVGPGDSTWIFMPVEISAAAGRWTGIATASMEVEDAPGVVLAIPATTRTDGWGNQVEINTKDANPNRSTRLWVRVHIPNDPNLQGKKARVHMTLNAQFPVVMGNHFVVQGALRRHVAELQFGPARSGFTYQITWFVSVAVVFLLGLAMQVACVLQAYRLWSTLEMIKVVHCDPPPTAITTNMDPPTNDATGIQEQPRPHLPGRVPDEETDPPRGR